MDPLTSATGGLGRPPGRPNSIGQPNADFSGIGESEEASSGSFANVLTEALGEVQDLQNEADDAIRKLATGKAQDVHQVMVAFEQARLSMQMLTEVRNKLVEAYQEVSRMPL